MRLELIEPLRYLFKDEVRAAGSELGLPDEVVWRQPFPGPGLAIRILGEVTHEGLETLREADAIVNEEIDNANLTRELWQSVRRADCFTHCGRAGRFPHVWERHCHSRRHV